MKLHHSLRIRQAARLLALAALFPAASAVAQATEPGLFSDLTIGSETANGGMIVSKGNYGGTSPALPVGGSAGPSMIWLPRKAAFHVGHGLATESLLGNFSFSSGLGSWAAGDCSTAAGFLSEASGRNSTALGDNPTASGDSSAAIGAGTTASGPNSTALGLWTTASGLTSTALGAFGYALGGFSTVMGVDTYAIGEGSTAMGVATGAAGHYSTAMGTETIANSFASMAIGRMNLGGGNPTQWVATDPLFEIGNVSPEAVSQTPSNALTVYKNGNLDVQGNIEAGGVVTSAPGGDIPMFTGN